VSVPCKIYKKIIRSTFVIYCAWPQISLMDCILYSFSRVYYYIHIYHPSVCIIRCSFSWGVRSTFHEKWCSTKLFLIVWRVPGKKDFFDPIITFWENWFFVIFGSFFRNHVFWGVRSKFCEMRFFLFENRELLE
jgi:hypothetical protein